MLLAPAWVADLRRLPSTTLLCTDASTSYGVGVSYHLVSEKLAQSLLRLSESHGDFINLRLKPGTKCKERKGVAQLIPLSFKDFKHAVSFPINERHRPEFVEMIGVSVGLDWLLRNSQHVSTWQTVLVDSRVSLGIVRKGRTSAGSLRHVMRKIASRVLIGNLHLNVLCIPTEHNPADVPSRGLKSRKRSGTASPRVKREFEKEKSHSLPSSLVESAFARTLCRYDGLHDV